MGSNRDRGDTLIEVMLALVLLAVIIVGAVTIMNRGKQSVQVAIENTEVRMHISGQTELLRYLRNEYLRDNNKTTWINIVDATDTSNFNAGCNGATPVLTGGTKPAFFINPFVTGTISHSSFDPTPAIEAASPGDGLWIEAKKSMPGINPAYVDFQITACWPGVGSIDSREIISTARFYDPPRL